nr:unnamed protein product [Callosobruchus analis]
MPPNSEFVPPSSLGIKPPATRSQSQKLTVHVWLQDKQQTDGAEGLWRVHDGLYDLTQFVDKHPGGKDWLTLTKVILGLTLYISCVKENQCLNGKKVYRVFPVALKRSQGTQRVHSQAF